MTHWHNIPFIIYIIDLMLNKNRSNTICANCIQNQKKNVRKPGKMGVNIFL